MLQVFFSPQEQRFKKCPLRRCLSLMLTEGMTRGILLTHIPKA